MAFKLLLLAAAFLSSFCSVSGYCSKYSSDCGSGQVCCYNQCTYGSSCYGRYCSLDSHCSSGEVCCDNECWDSLTCYGHSCSMDSDCSSSELCCSGTCGYYCDYTVPIVAIVCAIVFGSIFVIGIVVFIVICCQRRRRPVGGRVINQPQIITGTTTTTNYPPLQGQQPYYQHPGYGAFQPPPYEVRVVDSEMPAGGVRTTKMV